MTAIRTILLAEDSPADAEMAIDALREARLANPIVHVEDGTAVRDVMIGGRFVVRDGRLLTLDLARLAQQAEAARERLTAVNAPMKLLAEKLQEAVARFCVGLAREPYRVERYGAPLR